MEITPLAELGIDSLDFFEAVMALEERLGCEIPIENLDAADRVLWEWLYCYASADVLRRLLRDGAGTLLPMSM